MNFQLEVTTTSNEANKNKYTNFQLTVSTKNNLKKAEDQALHLQRQLVILCCLDLKVLCCLASCCLKVYFSSATYVFE